MTKGSLRRSLICHSYVIHNIHPSIHPSGRDLPIQKQNECCTPSNKNTGSSERTSEPRTPSSCFSDWRPLVFDAVLTWCSPAAPWAPGCLRPPSLRSSRPAAWRWDRGCSTRWTHLEPGEFNEETRARDQRWKRDARVHPLVGCSLYLLYWFLSN